jgi:hypothetical protein
MNHNHIYSDSVSCEQLKAVDIISKEEGHPKKQTNEKYTNIVQPCGTSNSTSWNIWESSTLLIECLWVSSLLVCQSTVSTLALMFRVIKNLLLTMYYKENFMWNSIIVTSDGLQ